MSNDIIVLPPDAHGMLPVSVIKAQVAAIQKLLSDVLIDKVHYGRIPGCGDRPVLLKAGAEKICSMFRIAPEIHVDDLSSPDVVAYRVTVRAISASGTFLGAGIGECSSEEDKYKWCGPKPGEWDATPEDRRRIKYGWKQTERQVRQHPANVANTILKMAKKRALVDMVLTVTAASDIFEQDMDEAEIAEAIADAAPVPSAAPAPSTSWWTPTAYGDPKRMIEPAEAGALESRCRTLGIQTEAMAEFLGRKRGMKTPYPSVGAITKAELGRLYALIGRMETGEVAFLKNADGKWDFADITPTEAGA